MSTVVHLLRHGEVDNPHRILYGRLPGYQLSARGQQQAQTVAKTLATHDLGYVVASPLRRAQQTAEPAAEAHQLEVHADEDLIEAENIFQGQRVAFGDGALRQPKYWARLWNPLRPSWGEPYTRVAHRMLEAVHRARARARGREALCVSHQLPIWTLRRFLEGRRLWHDPRNRQCSLGSLTSLVFAGDELAEIIYSEPAGTTDRTVAGA